MTAENKKHQAQSGPDVDHLNTQADQVQDQAPEQEAPETQGQADVEKKLEEANDRLLRLQAEFDNYRKRTAKERLDLILTASEDVIRECSLYWMIACVPWSRWNNWKMQTRIRWKSQADLQQAVHLFTGKGLKVIEARARISIRIFIVP